MSQPAAKPMSLEDFFTWQERQDDRFELLDGVPVRMMGGASNRHDDVVMNILVMLGNQLRGSGCRPFTADGAVETRPGQIRRPDAGVDCGERDPNAFTAGEPRIVVEVMSPSTRDVDTISKLAEYQAIGSLDTILYVETNWAEVTIWIRAEDRSWTRDYVLGIEGAVEVRNPKLRLPLVNIYDGVSFPPGPHLIRNRGSLGPAGEQEA